MSTINAKTVAAMSAMQIAAAYGPAKPAARALLRARAETAAEKSRKARWTNLLRDIDAGDLARLAAVGSGSKAVGALAASRRAAEPKAPKAAKASKAPKAAAKAPAKPKASDAEPNVADLVAIAMASPALRADPARLAAFVTELLSA